MIIKSVNIENILSIASASVSFGTSGLVLVDGWNYDDDTANGAGKTAIFNAISWGVFGKVPRKITVTQLLRDGCKNGHVYVEIDTGSCVLAIKRSRPNKIEYFIDGEKEDMTQEGFEKKLGMSYSQYLISMYAAQTNGQRLIDLNDTDKKDFLLRLMNLERFSAIRKDVDTVVKSLNKDRDEVEKKILSDQTKVDVYKEQQEDADLLKKKIKLLDTSPLEKKVKELHQVARPDLSQFNEVLTKINNQLLGLDAVDNELIMLRSQHKELSSQLDKLQNNEVTIKHGIECPHCDNEFQLSPDGAVTLDDLKNKREEDMSRVKDTIKTVTDSINSKSNTRAQRNELNTLLMRVKKKKEDQEQAFNKAQVDIANYKSQIAINTNEIHHLSESIKLQDSLKNSINTLTKNIDVNLHDLKKIKSDIEIHETISAVLAPTGAPAYVVDSVVDVFNQKISDYVSLVWPSAHYVLLTYKENKDKEVKAKFSEKLTIGGRETSIGSLSGGEYRCLSLAMDFTIVDVMETMFGTSLNPIVLDEPFEGLDTANRERVIGMLNHLSKDRQIIVIDHASEAKSMFSDIIRIEKRGGISKIV